MASPSGDHLLGYLYHVLLSMNSADRAGDASESPEQKWPSVVIFGKFRALLGLTRVGGLVRYCAFVHETHSDSSHAAHQKRLI